MCRIGGYVKGSKVPLNLFVLSDHVCHLSALFNPFLSVGQYPFSQSVSFLGGVFDLWGEGCFRVVIYLFLCSLFHGLSQFLFGFLCWPSAVIIWYAPFDLIDVSFLVEN